MELSAERIAAALQRPELPVYVYDQLDSTSEECRRRLLAGQRQCLVLAVEQSGGKGRSGKQFFSPAGGLYMSLALPMGGDAAALTCRAAVATAEAIEAVTGIDCGIKWVNDLYVREKKVCGILAEAVGDTVILGIGVNLVSQPLPAELQETVGFLDCGDAREALAVELTKRLLAPAGGYMERYRQRSLVLGRELLCRCGDREFTARALAIDDQGGLVMEGPAGRETLRFGQVSIRGKF